MLKWIFKLLFRLRGWKLYTATPKEAFNSIIVAAPHTSNWDFVYAIAALDTLGLNPKFTIKKEHNVFILGNMIRNLGALWIDRSPVQGQTVKKSMTKVMSELFENNTEPLSLLVTAEGTRSKNTMWKTGFYYAALEAKVPICMAYMDYKNRITGVQACFMPVGDIEQDMRVVMDFYRDKMDVGKYPENFALDERFS